MPTSIYPLRSFPRADWSDRHTPIASFSRGSRGPTDRESSHPHIPSAHPVMPARHALHERASNKQPPLHRSDVSEWHGFSTGLRPSVFFVEDRYRRDPRGRLGQRYSNAGVALINQQRRRHSLPTGASSCTPNMLSCRTTDQTEIAKDDHFLESVGPAMTLIQSIRHTAVADSQSPVPFTRPPLVRRPSRHAMVLADRYRAVECSVLSPPHFLLPPELQTWNPAAPPAPPPMPPTSVTFPDPHRLAACRRIGALAHISPYLGATARTCAPYDGNDWPACGVNALSPLRLSKSGRICRRFPLGLVQRKSRFSLPRASFM